MAIKATVETNFGEQREVYIRINNVETNNHNVPSVVLVRGFLSREAYLAKKQYVWEAVIECPLDVSTPLWPQIYAAVKAKLTAEGDPLGAKVAVNLPIQDV